MTQISLVSLEQIIRNCEEQTSNFIHKRISDTRYCFELFRRALSDRNNDAINAVYEIYRRLLEKWASQHPLLGHTNETAEYFALAAFRSFQFALRPEKLSKFSELRQILAYLSACVDTSIKQYVRRFPQEELLKPDQDFGYAVNFEEVLEFQKLWEHICKLLDDDDSILLAYCIYVQHMKPKEIVEEYKRIWPNAEVIRVQGQNIKRKLHSDPKLRSWGRQ
jgi:hypothetical protein